MMGSGCRIGTSVHVALARIKMGPGGIRRFATALLMDMDGIFTVGRQPLEIALNAYSRLIGRGEYGRAANGIGREPRNLRRSEGLGRRVLFPGACGHKQGAACRHGQSET